MRFEFHTIAGNLKINLFSFPMRQKFCLIRQYCLLDVVGAEKGEKIDSRTPIHLHLSSPLFCSNPCVMVEPGRAVFTQPVSGGRRIPMG